MFLLLSFSLFIKHAAVYLANSRQIDHASLTELQRRAGQVLHGEILALAPTQATQSFIMWLNGHCQAQRLHAKRCICRVRNAPLFFVFFFSTFATTSKLKSHPTYLEPWSIKQPKHCWRLLDALAVFDPHWSENFLTKSNSIFKVLKRSDN